MKKTTSFLLLFSLVCISFSKTIAQNSCDASALKQFSSNEDEQARIIIQNPKGGYIIGGGRNEAALLLFIDKDLTITKQKAFDITSTKDVITGMTIDADNNLLVVGYDETALLNTGFAFKYDLANDKIIWTRSLSDGVYRLLPINVIQNPTNKNYIIAGQIDYYSTQNNDAYFLEVNQQTGETVGTNFYDMTDQPSDSDAFANLLLHNNSIYTVGRNTYGNNPGFQGMRFAFSKFDLDGKQQYSKYFFKDITNDARLYLRDLAIEANTFFSCGHGDYAGIDMQINCNVFLLCHNENGNLSWAKQYNLNNLKAQRVTKVVKTAKGIFLLGYFNNIVNQDMYITFADNNGDIKWSKSLDLGGDDQIHGAIAIGIDEIIFVGKTKKNNNNDIYVGKINSEGNASSNCQILKDFPVLTTDLPTTTFEKPFATHKSNLTNDKATPNEKQITNYQEINFCKSISTDIKIKTILAECNKDSLILIEICNIGSEDFEEHIPISFYLQNPYSTAAKVVKKVKLFVNLTSNQCAFFSVKAPMLVNQNIFVSLNDEAKATTPYNLNTVILNTLSEECNFKNNLATYSLKIDFNLDNKIEFCEGDSILLDSKKAENTIWFTENQSVICTNCNTTKVKPSSKTFYYLKAKLDGCDVSDTIFAHPTSLSVALRSDTALCKNDILNLHAPKGFDSYVWTKEKKIIDCNNCDLLKIVGEDSPKQYQLEVTKGKCSAKDDVLIGVETYDVCVTCKEGKLFIPNSFSPNDDGINDEFFPYSSECNAWIKEFKIFDRWGNEVFFEKDFPPNDEKFAWKGTFKDRNAQEGIYTYLVILETQAKKIVKHNGNVLLIR